MNDNELALLTPEEREAWTVVNKLASSGFKSYEDESLIAALEEIARLRARLESATQFRVSDGLYIVKHGHNWVITGRGIASVPMELHRKFPAAAAAFAALEEDRKGEG